MRERRKRQTWRFRKGTSVAQASGQPERSVILAACRTPFGKFGGGLMDVSPVDLGAHAMRAALARGNVAPEAVDGYVFGNVVSAGHGQLIARQPRKARTKARRAYLTSCPFTATPMSFHACS